MKRPRLFHPSRKRLHRWLEHGDAELDDHIAACHRCATTLESLAETEPALGDALRTLLAPPADLHPRLQSGMAAKMQARDDLKLLVELLGLPVQTLRAMGPPDPSPPAAPSL